MNDLSIVYYTANTIPESTGQKVRDYLLKVTESKIPIISVSQKPIDFGKNICVGQIGRSKYNCYKQILAGVREVKTKYIACAEDDTLYSQDHFKYRPKDDDIFSYDANMWFAEENYYWRWEDYYRRSGMWGCIARTDTLLNNLTTRYSLYPADPFPSKYLFWGEPGTHDQLFGMQNKFGLFDSEYPNVVFRYRESMGGNKYGHRERRRPENRSFNIGPFGGINKLWKSYWS